MNLIDQQKSRLAGCDAFLPKPVDEQSLLALIGQQLRLEWIYETVQDEEQENDNHNEQSQEKTSEYDPPNRARLIAPPTEELERLYELATLGRMSALRKQLDYLEQVDQSYAPFTNKVRELARGFEDEKILALIEEQL